MSSHLGNRDLGKLRAKIFFNGGNQGIFCLHVDPKVFVLVVSTCHVVVCYGETGKTVSVKRRHASSMFNAKSQMGQQICFYLPICVLPSFHGRQKQTQVGHKKICVGMTFFGLF